MKYVFFILISTVLAQVSLAQGLRIWTNVPPSETQPYEPVDDRSLFESFEDAWNAFMDGPQVETVESNYPVTSGPHLMLDGRIKFIISMDQPDGSVCTQTRTETERGSGQFTMSEPSCK